MNKLIEAAQAVITHWDSPLWKDVPATAVYIGALREAIAALEAELARVVEPVAWMADDGRVCNARTKDQTMHAKTAESFCIPLYTAPPEPVNAELLEACKSAFAVVGAMQPSKPLINLAYQLAEAIKKAGATT